MAHRLWKVLCGLLWAKRKKLLIEANEGSSQLCTRTAIWFRSRKLQAACLFRWKGREAGEGLRGSMRLEGQSACWKAKGTKNGRMKCRLREV